MFGLLNDVTDLTTKVAGDVIEVGTLGLVQSKDAKKLADLGWDIYKISNELNISVEDVEKLLKK